MSARILTITALALSCLSPVAFGQEKVSRQLYVSSRDGAGGKGKPGIYIYDVLQDKVRNHGLGLREAYFQTLHQTGKAVIFTGLCLAGGVAAWLFSELQFQRDMGKLLVFMFIANMLGAVLLCPAYYRFLVRIRGKG